MISILPTSTTPTVVGPYSAWPRRRRASGRRGLALSAAAIVAVGVFVHCALPMILGA